MKFLCSILIFLFVGFVAPCRAQTEIDLSKKAYQSTALLYSQNDDGGMRMRCTATAFEKSKTGYLFVSAAHCVATDDTQHERVEVERTRFYITYDESGDKKFYPAKIVMVGYQHRGEDFSIFDVKTEEVWETTPLGDEGKEVVGSPLINVASPGGFGKQVFHGWVSSLFIDRPIVEGDINWTGTMFLQIESGPGSSGSALISVGQRAIVAFLVGHASGNVIAMPVSRFKKFRQMVIDGKYRWYQVQDQ
jgi:S1-C subfamily serine protease